MIAAPRRAASRRWQISKQDGSHLRSTRQRSAHGHNNKNDVNKPRDGDDEISRRGNCLWAIGPDFGTELLSASVAPPVEHTVPGCGEEKPWSRAPSVQFVTRAGVRLSEGHFGLSVSPGDQLPLSGPPVRRSRSLGGKLAKALQSDVLLTQYVW